MSQEKEAFPEVAAVIIAALLLSWATMQYFQPAAPAPAPPPPAAPAPVPTPPKQPDCPNNRCPRFIQEWIRGLFGTQ